MGGFAVIEAWLDREGRAFNKMQTPMMIIADLCRRPLLYSKRTDGVLNKS